MTGTLVLIAYTLLMLGATFWFTRRSTNSEDFCVSNRKIGLFQSSMSIAAAWIWAPALFVSAERAYGQGWVGLFWFTVPNILCLVFFSSYAVKIRDRFPTGLTLSGYMNTVYSPRVKRVYLTQLTGLAVFSSAVQLLAGATVLHLITGFPFWLLTFILCAIGYSYSRYSGIRANVVTDALQLGIILLVCTVCVPWSVSQQGGFSAVLSGLGGISGRFTDLFSADGMLVFWTFGLPTAIGLTSGPFGDQSFWQRAFSIDKTKVRKAFVTGALLFGIVPLSMGTLGFLASSSGIAFQSTSVLSFEFITAILPSWVVIPFLFMILSGLLSTLDSNQNAVASLATDMKKDITVRHQHRAMLLLMVVAIGIANIPGLTITTLFMIYGTLRATTLLPTILTLNGRKLSEAGIFYGVIAGLVIGLPLFVLGTLGGNTLIKVIGCLSAAGLPGIVALLWPRKEVAR